MGGALAEVAVAVNFMPKNMVGIGAGLTVIGASLEILANVLNKFGNLSPEQIAESLSQVALTEIIGVVLVYAVKSVFENLSKNNSWPDKPSRG